MKKIFLALGLLGFFSSGVQAATPFESSVNQVYELSAQIRSLRSTKDPEYGSLIKDCRKTLYWSMNVLAKSGNWDSLSDKIPDATVCSFTGKVLPATEFEWEDKFAEAEALARETKTGNGAAPIQKSPFASSEEVPQEPKNDPDETTLNVSPGERMKLAYFNQSPEFREAISASRSETIEKIQEFKKNLLVVVRGSFSSCQSATKEFYMSRFQAKSDSEIKEFVIDYACYMVLNEQIEKSPDEDYLKKNLDSAEIAFNLLRRGSIEDVSIVTASAISGTDPKKIKEIIDAVDFFTEVGRVISVKSK